MQKFKSFIYQHVKWVTQEGKKCLEVIVIPRKNSKVICSGCHKQGSCYDKQQERLFEFVPLLGYLVYFRYRMRRVNCKNCGVKIESVPWSDGKQTMTKAFMQFLAGWAKKLSWQETARSFQSSWQKVFASVKYVVIWGLANCQLSEVKSIGVDETAWLEGFPFIEAVKRLYYFLTKLKSTLSLVLYRQ